ncbi:MAG: tRNA pseudouridine(55) synthase TruB [Calditrichaeota bacterium]|nr:MAG: tRNA pseudouridine(55) synthase TruB [Calditrichota bacterium]MBL1203904.1 tRNA pseudouridine(55) synthase TruB [Calditrichota bacterium]NOG43737.1 tRNA pseudouridine(55) synthase TruB [Calditrichota bacterium]
MIVPVLKKGSELKFSDLSNGFLVLIDKPVDWTSFDVCKKIRNTIGMKKVGHAGTLDPFATGLLLIGAGKGTKMMTEFSQASKKYEALIQFGKESDSYDITGKIVNEQEDFNLDYSQIEEVVESMSGEIEQTPPMFSAKKVKGKALYKYARQGIEIERKAVKVRIIESKINFWEKPFLKMNLHVSKGTYIRSYAHDLGKALHVPALLKELQRTQVDNFLLEDSFTIEEFCTFWEKVAA